MSPLDSQAGDSGRSRSPFGNGPSSRTGCESDGFRGWQSQFERVGRGDAVSCGAVLKGAGEQHRQARVSIDLQQARRPGDLA